MIVIGADIHNRAHTLVALDAETGAARRQGTIPASDDGTLAAPGAISSFAEGHWNNQSKT